MLCQGANIDKGGISRDGKNWINVLYKHKSKLESKETFFVVVYGTKGCCLARSPDAEGLSFKGRNFSPVALKPCCLSQEAYFVFFYGIILKSVLTKQSTGNEKEEAD